MIVKKYKAPTETEAVLMAKDDLGPGAVVLNVKTMTHKGIAKLFKKDYVEITAALEEKDFAATVNGRNSGKAVQTSVKPGNRQVSNGAGPGTAQSPASTIDLRTTDEKDNTSQPSAIEEKLNSLHDMLRNQMKEEAEKAEKAADKEAGGKEDGGEKDAHSKAVNNNFKSLKLIYNKLLQNEVDEKYANALINDIESSLKKESTLDTILASVYQKLILKLGEPATIADDPNRKVIFFIGPTGVGKTTTIAKLASDYKLGKNRKVAMITADTYRIAAVEQLNTYASILDVPVNVIYTPSEILENIEQLSDYDVIFVDTAGRSHKNEQQRLEILEMIDNVKKSKLGVDVEIYLVLSVTTKYKDLISIVDAYKEIEDRRLLFTKLDETVCLGNILNIRAYSGAPLSYTTSGQNVPDDIETVDVQALAKSLLGGD